MTVMTNAPAEPPAPDQPGPTAGTAAAPPPPPLAPTGGYATRFNLVRPAGDRYIAGVCGALGRATNTDPVLWRVLLPVLLLVNGLGAVLYLLGVLLIPSEGDTGSPIEALAGRGRSRMRQGATITLIVITSLAVLGEINHIGGGLLIGLAVVGVIALVAATHSGTPGSWPTTWPTVRKADNGFTVNWPQAPAPVPTPVPPVPMPDAVSDDVASDPVTTAPPTGVDDLAAADDDAYATAEPPVPTYHEPFAPYGPYAASSPYPQGFPGLSPTTVIAPPPQPAGRVRHHSPVRRITVSAALLVVGFLALIDVTGVRSVSTPTYFAAALAAIGIGMFIASFFGRVRGPITLGVLLTIGLLATATADALPRPYAAQDVRIAPTSPATLRSSYDQHYGTFTLDLTRLAPDPSHREVDVTMKFGRVDIELPPQTYTVVSAHAGAGVVDINGDRHSGIDARTTGSVNAQNQGKDGGLTIRVTISAGDVEVRS
jgi:phage shock protein PspC (stress-responsive transcriptional regulator)